MKADSEREERPSRFTVGIDLGTTNSALCYVDTSRADWRVATFAIRQVVAPQEVETRETLPSFHYEAAPGEFAASGLRLPWEKSETGRVVGFFARERGALQPGRSIASAKSWLCHAGVDRAAELLPWHGAEDVTRLSPVEASSRYLSHLRSAWDHEFPADPLAKQDIALTLPASFDEVSRELTIRAAKLAGLPRVTLIEEPQAAFYAWLNSKGDRSELDVRPGQKILVIDIGGGTSDFTLINVRAGEGGKVRFHRVAVGDHLILGGDNLDLALAHHLESRFSRDGELAPREWSLLVRACRQVKETLLGESPPEGLTVSLPGTGSKLIGGATRVAVTRDEVEKLLVDGFLPRVGFDEKPATRRSGFQEFGLPYAADAAITKYLAAFLAAHRHGPNDEPATPGVDPARPDFVLFNGGLFASPILRERLLEVLSSWFREPDAQLAWRPTVLRNDRLDLAVAQGAAYYGMVRRGMAEKIAAGAARSYYLGVGVSDAPVTSDGNAESDENVASDAAPASASLRAMCVLPAGIEEGQSVDLSNRAFALSIRQPVEFPVYSSSVRLTDAAGLLIHVDVEKMTPLPPIRTVLHSVRKGDSDRVEVILRSRLTEWGTLELVCVEARGPRTWKLDFDVRAATRTDLEGHAGAAEEQGIVERSVVEACQRAIREVYAPAAKGGETPDGLPRRLEEMAQAKRRDWPSSLSRQMWETLFELEAGRRKSSAHEARWLYLLGFTLRPGYGLAIDDWRVAQTWRALQGKRAFHTPNCRVEWLVMWRRIAGGLTAGQQRSLAEPLLAQFRTTSGVQLKGARAKRPEVTLTGHELAETWRLLGGLELLPAADKMSLGSILFEKLEREKSGGVRDAAWWTIGRLGARAPLYGPLNAVIPTETAQQWIARLFAKAQPRDATVFPLVQLAFRVGDRHRDISRDWREKALVWLEDRQAPERFRELVREGGKLLGEERELAFGESLPPGLRSL